MTIPWQKRIRDCVEEDIAPRQKDQDKDVYRDNNTTKEDMCIKEWVFVQL